MEPVSLTIGIAGLYNLFVDISDRVKDYRDFGRESSTTIARFDASKLRLQHWAKAVGIGDRGLTDSHHVRLDDQQTASVVRNILFWSCKLFQKVEYNTTSLKLPVRQRTDGEQWSLPSHGGGVEAEYQQKFSRKGRLAWSTGSKTKLNQDVQQFEELVNILHSVVTPPRDASDDGATNTSHLEEKFELLADVGLERLLELATTQRQRSLDEWLDATKDDDQYERFLDACLDGTCEWILSHPSYLAWENRDEENNIAKLLWINGPAGFGKTILAASLIHHIRESLQLPLVYCFSSNHAQSADALEGVIRTWLAQLVRMDKDAFDVAYQLLQERNTRKASKEDIWTLLNKIVVQIQRCVLVLDGLDQFPSRDDQRKIFLSRLKTCIQSTGIAVLITSRTDFDISSELRPSVPEVDNYSILECKISEDTVKSDIDTFASSIIERRLPRQADSLRKELSARMAERCQGQFLWLKLQQSQLRDSKSPKMLRKSIEVMPQGLGSTYEQSWNNIQALEEPDRSRAIDTLRWLTFALQPLTVQELAEALVINLDADFERFSEEDLPDAIDDEYIDGEIKQLCGSLVEVQNHEDPRCRIVRLVHASVSEFLAAKLPLPPSLELAPMQSPSGSAQHSLLAACCICFLDLAETWRPGGDQRDPPFRTYATYTWFRHLRIAGGYYNHVSGFVSRFLKPGNVNFEMWRKDLEGRARSSNDNPEKEFENSSSSAAASFYYAAYFGLVPAMIQLHDIERVDINSVGGQFGTALQAVCVQDDTEAFDCLMQWHADPTIRAGDYGSALNAAAYSGYIDMVEMLLDTGVFTSSLTSELHEAMRLAAGRGSLEVVRLLIDRGAPVDPPEALYPLHRYLFERATASTPLLAATPSIEVEILAATLSNKVKIMRLLLERGANPDLPDEPGWTALHLAANNDNYLEAVELLLLHGANVDSQGAPCTPLHIASSFGAIDVVEVLLNNGATVDAHDECQDTALHHAARARKIDVLAYLLHRGANPDVQDENLRTPLHLASRNEDIDAMKALLENDATIDAYDKWQCTPLHHAARAGWIDVLAYLLHRGANPNARNLDGSTPLHLACKNDDIDAIEALLENRATLDAYDKMQKTPLHDAARYGSIDVLACLLYRGANPNAQGVGGWTPLRVSAPLGEMKAITTLLEHGADVNINAQTNARTTPLGIAIFNRITETARLLIDRGADIHITSEDGLTALDIAIEEGNAEIARLLIDRGADIHMTSEDAEMSLRVAIVEDKFEFARLLIEHGADVNARIIVGECESTPLRIAILNDKINIAGLLIDHGADVNIQSEDGETALRVAIENNNTEIARLLIDRGADIHITSKNGETALRVAISRSDDGLVSYLIQSGADLGYMDRYGMTCSNWLQRARPHLMMPEVEGQKPDEISSGPDKSVLRGTLLTLAEDMRSDEAKTRSGLYELAHCFLLLDMEDQAQHAYQALRFVCEDAARITIRCNNCGTQMTPGNSFFVCKICPKTEFCESCIEGHSEETRRKICLSHKFLKVVPLQATSRNDDDDDDDKAFRTWLDEIIERFTE